MPRAKKTVDVQAIKDKLNDLLRNSRGNDPYIKGVRQGYITIVEEILMATGNYKGYRYLTAGEMNYGDEPGVSYDWEGRGVTKFLDETRISFY